MGYTTVSDSPLTPLGEAIRRLRVQILLQAQPLLLVRTEDVETALDALEEAERQIPWDRGGEA